MPGTQKNSSDWCMDGWVNEWMRELRHEQSPGAVKGFVLFCFVLFLNQGKSSSTPLLNEAPKTHYEIWQVAVVPRWLSDKRIRFPMQEMKVRSQVGKVPWRRKWQPTPVFLPGKSHGRRSLVGYSPWGHKIVRHNWASQQQQWFSHCFLSTEVNFPGNLFYEVS